MAERVQVVVEAKDAASGVLRGITQQLGSLGSATEELTAGSINWGNVAQMAYRIVADVVKDAFKATTEYASSVRDLALASGTSAQEASRLLQVLDDFEIQAGDITTATKALTKQGLAPTVETIAQLSDQYLQLNTAQERNAFIIENLGRGGAKWHNVLKEGSDAILLLNDGISESLILNDEQIRQYEEMRLNQDEFNDNILAIQVSLVNAFVPAINETVEGLRRFQAAQTELENQGVTPYTAHRLALMGVGIEAKITGKMEDDLATSITNAGDAASDSSIDYKKLLDMTMKLNDATATQINQLAYQDLYKQLAEDADGLTESERQALNEIGVELGIFDQKAVNTAEQVRELNQAFIDGQVSIMAYVAALKIIPAVVNTTVTTSGTYVEGYGANAYKADGTGGEWETVPSGYPNDTYRVAMSSGEKYKVMTQGESEGSSGATNYFYGNVTFTNGGDGSGFMEQR